MFSVKTTVSMNADLDSTTLGTMDLSRMILTAENATLLVQSVIGWELKIAWNVLQDITLSQTFITICTRNVFLQKMKRLTVNNSMKTFQRCNKKEDVSLIARQVKDLLMASAISALPTVLNAQRESARMDSVKQDSERMRLDFVKKIDLSKNHSVMYLKREYVKHVLLDSIGMLKKKLVCLNVKLGSLWDMTLVKSVLIIVRFVISFQENVSNAINK